MNDIRRISISMACLALVATVLAQGQTTAPPPSKPLSTSLGMVVFPAKGQTPQKQSQDEGECYAWSKGQTGVDPMAPPPAAAQPAAQQAAQPAPTADGSRLRGAARGAAAGAVIGEVANNDAGQGAAVGATVGVVAGGRQSRKNQQQATQQQQQATQQQAAQQQATQQQQMDLFKKGFAACLEPKGYTVK
jgi:pyruvate/2-oxoglutarate dehydrogenase complex dihydrolipoamide acyltransferase (E2) component